MDIVELVHYFNSGLSDRSFATSGPAEHLVRAAMFVTSGLFHSFFGTANLIALQLAQP